MDETWGKTLVVARLAETREIKLKRNHDRYPDIGLRISVRMPYEDSPDVATMQYKDYIGEYCGHGQSKTAFILNGPSGDPFHGKILKVIANSSTRRSDETGMTRSHSGQLIESINCNQPRVDATNHGSLLNQLPQLVQKGGE